MGEYDFIVDSFVGILGGCWLVMNFGDFKFGFDVFLKLMFEVDYFWMVKDGEDFFEIDIEVGKCIIGGMD